MWILGNDYKCVSSWIDPVVLREPGVHRARCLSKLKGQGVALSLTSTDQPKLKQLDLSGTNSPRHLHTYII